MEKFLNLLPEIAEHPFAITAYICAIAGWLCWSIKRERYKHFLQTLDRVPKRARPDLCRKSGFIYDDLAALPKKDKLKLLSRRYLLIGYVATLIGVVLLTLAAIRVLQAQDPKKIVEQIEQSRVATQAKYDDLQRRSLLLASGVKGAVDSAELINEFIGDPELKRLAAKLIHLLSRFDAEFGKDHTTEETLTIRLARATAANASGNFGEALRLLSETDAAILTKRATDASGIAGMLLAARGNALFAQTDWLKAGEACDQLLSIQPNNLSASLLKGFTQFNLRQFDQSIISMESVLKQFKPRASPADTLSVAVLCSALGEAHQYTGNLSSAVEYFDRAIASLRSFPMKDMQQREKPLARLHGSRGSAQLTLGNLKPAISDLQESIQLYESLLHRGYEEVREELAAKLNKRSSANMALGLFSAAAEDCDRGISITESSPRHSPSIDKFLMMHLVNRQQIYALTGRLAEALRDSDRSLSIYRKLDDSQLPDKSEGVLGSIYSARATVLAEMGDGIGSLAFSEKAIDVLNENSKSEDRRVLDGLAITFYNRGVTLNQLNRPVEAIKDFTKALVVYWQITSNNVSATSLPIGNVFAERGVTFSSSHQMTEAMRDFEDALTCYKNRLEEGYFGVEGDRARVFFNRGNAYLSLNRPLEAIKDYTSAIDIRQKLINDQGLTSLKPNLAKTLISRGDAQLKYGNQELGIADYKKALEIDAVGETSVVARSRLLPLESVVGP